MIFINCTKCKKGFKISGAAHYDLVLAKKQFICADCASKKSKVVKTKAVNKKVTKKASTRKE